MRQPWGNISRYCRYGYDSEMGKQPTTLAPRWRFSVRDVMWLIAVVFLAMAWGVDHWWLGQCRRQSRNTEQVLRSAQEKIEVLKRELRNNRRQRSTDSPSYENRRFRK